MVKGESGLLALARCDERAALDRRATASSISRPARWPSPIGAERPEKLRGPQHHFAWCDELAKWPQCARATDLGQSDDRPAPRRARRARSSPPRRRPVPLLKRILGLPRCVATHGRTDENPDTARRFPRRDGRDVRRHPARPPGAGRHAVRRSRRRAVDARDAGARAAGAGLPAPANGSWRSTHRRRRRSARLDRRRRLRHRRLRAGRGRRRLGPRRSHRPGLRPEAWARRVAGAADVWGAQLVVAEKNQGGDMIESVLRGVDADLPVRLVHADRQQGGARRAGGAALRDRPGEARRQLPRAGGPALRDHLCAAIRARASPTAPTRWSGR